jgi:hypothetical protein
MKNIINFKQFEYYHNPMATIDSISHYYICHDCNALWYNINKRSTICKYCQSTNISEISTDEWLLKVKYRLNDDEEYKSLEDEIYKLINIDKTMFNFNKLKNKQSIN